MNRDNSEYVGYMAKNVEESQIIELIKLGDPTAVEYWFSEYQSILAQFIKSKVENPQDVAEIVQETFLGCLKQIAFFKGQSSLQTWMISVARHEVADYYRKKYAKRALQLLPLTQELLGTKVNDAHEISEKVKEVLAKMSESSRELLQKKYVDNMKVQDIAVEWGRSDKSIESELFRARNEFKTLFLLSE